MSVSVSVVKKMDNYNVNEAFLENLSLGLSSSLGKELENLVTFPVFGKYRKQTKIIKF